MHSNVDEIFSSFTTFVPYLTQQVYISRIRIMNHEILISIGKTFLASIAKMFLYLNFKIPLWIFAAIRRFGFSVSVIAINMNCFNLRVH